ncbi:feruloyl-CoA synthase [Spirosoma flavum]|uniref:Feruloyl-CoA synthase n=1 Tax=Spirosoma flavum TaxID=2048557 RepID=A0ABW6AKC0_9BACT
MTTLNLKQTPFRPVQFGPVSIEKITRPDGTLLLRSTETLAPHPNRMTERLPHWASATPDRVFMGQRDSNGNWRTVSFAQTFTIVRKLAQGLIDLGLTAETSMAILSENSIEHGLMALAALHVGIPYSAISPAYSLRSTDFAKLTYTLELLAPKLIFVSNGQQYEKALRACAGAAHMVYVYQAPEGVNAIAFDTLLDTLPTDAVEEAFAAVKPETVAKILFTSGTSGFPKGVINTHGMVCTNWQQITQTFPFLTDDDLTIIDWLPWNHTFGGNHNFGLMLFNGGSLYIDEGTPTPKGITITVANLRDIAPTLYFNVPKGFEELIPYFRRDKALCEHFFSRLKLLFYAGAGMAQHVWDAFEELAYETTGERVVIATGLGCTESSPSALFATKAGSFAGMLGVPVPGLDLKLVPNGGKLEARYRGANITPGYWRQPDATASAFDDEGFYCTGDALKFVDPNDPNEGVVFDGRIAEDFKLDTGTWVSVGNLRTKLITIGNGLIQDVVITGHDRAFVGAIVIPNIEYCCRLSGYPAHVPLPELVAHKTVINALADVLNSLKNEEGGSSTLIKKAVFADFTLSLDGGELTDKGSINQRAFLANHPEIVDELYKN